MPLNPDPLPHLPGIVRRETVRYAVGTGEFRKADYPWLVYAVFTLRCGRGGAGEDGTMWPGDYQRAVRHVHDLPEVSLIRLDPGSPGLGGLESDGRPAEFHIDLYGPRERT